ncbi:MAG: hypothetical protein ABIV26_07375 [Candidatus Limnocylindrales bacterium]
MRGRFAALGLGLSLTIAACSPVASPVPAGATPGPSIDGGPSGTAAAPSSQPAGTPIASTGGSTGGFTLPTTEAEVLALLPDKLCGEDALKSKFNFASVQPPDPEMAAALSALDKSTADVHMYYAAIMGQTPCTAVILNVAGVDESAYRAAFIAASAAASDAVTPATVAGKDVLTRPTDSGFDIIYFRGDTMFVASAPTQAEAEAAIALMP